VAVDIVVVEEVIGAVGEADPAGILHHQMAPSTSLSFTLVVYPGIFFSLCRLKIVFLELIN
jgi:hypothetical protein